MFRLHRQHEKEHGGPEQTSFERLIAQSKPEVQPSETFSLELRQRILGELPAQKALWASRERRHRLLTRLTAAAAVLLIAATAGWIIIGGAVKPAAASFAEVLKRVRNAKSVSYNVAYFDEHLTENRAHVVMVRPKKMRIGWLTGRVQIADYTLRRSMSIYPQAKKCIIAPLLATFPSDTDPLRDLENLSDTAGSPSGRETFLGHEAEIYEVKDQGKNIKIWVDVKEQIPLKVESWLQTEHGLELRTKLDAFNWNTSVVHDEFALTPPQGFAVEGTPEVSKEELICILLRTAATANQGIFPQKLDAEILARILSTNAITINESGSLGFIAGHEGQKRLVRTCLWGFSAIEDIQRDGEWHYVGGCKLGDETTVVCWWRSGSNKDRRILTGALKFVAQGQSVPSK